MRAHTDCENLNKVNHTWQQGRNAAEQSKGVLNSRMSEEMTYGQTSKNEMPETVKSAEAVKAEQARNAGEEEEGFKERWDLAAARLEELAEELENGDNGLPEDYACFFYRAADQLCKLNTICKAGDALAERSLEELQILNRDLYEDVLPEHYAESFANPVYAVSVMGEDMGRCMSFLQAEINSVIPDAFFGDEWELLIRQELLLEVYGAFLTAVSETGELPDANTIRDILYWYASDYSDVENEKKVRKQVDADCEESRRFREVIMDSDLSDLRYLYRYGCYITENELRTAKHIQELPEETIALMADTYTEGYRKGFIQLRVDLSKKETVNIHYCAGFERVVRRAIRNFEKMGLKSVIYRSSDSIFNRRGARKAGFYGAIANKQYDYDHREDDALVFDGNYKTRRLETLQAGYELVKEKAHKHAGPAVIEIFGEEPFAPVDSKEALHLSEAQQKLKVEFAQEAGELSSRYIPEEERSFTIIAFPVPSIGAQYEEIFDEIIRINTLDYQLYSNIQKKLIDALDEAEYVQVTGMNGNRTDLKVQLCKLIDPEKQTKFENCVADVNIPVGEVFTSPVLTGTNGVLHVKGVYLNDLFYENFEVRFKNGFTDEYRCTNYKDEEANKRYIRDNVLFHHERLPLGEFAIGTNTTAYVAAHKYEIAARLPILIAEKMGPHFALGDTCYSESEEVAVYNPDGKEIIARDNEVSILRKEDRSKAYFNCHTDVTIPYDELGALYGVRADGSEIEIIKDGRFVLDGCEPLNEPFSELG